MRLKTFKHQIGKSRRRGIIEVLGLVGVLLAALFAGWQALEAYKAGKAQKIGIAQQDEALQMDQRAFVTVVGAGWKDYSFVGNQPNSLRNINARAKIIVTGKTPAFEVRVREICKVVPTGSSPLGMSDAFTIHAPSFILNGESAEISCPVEDKPNGFTFKFVGEVTYRDYFKQPHSTAFCLENVFSLKTNPPDEGELRQCLLFTPQVN